MTINYYLDKPSSTTETSIYLFLRFGKTTLKFNTGQKIQPKYWNPDNTENHYRKFTGSPERNQYLTNLRSGVHSAYISKGEWNVIDLKEVVNALVVPKDSQRTL